VRIDSKTILLTTYKRDGTPVGTAVNIAYDGDRSFFRTWETAGKAKRLRRNPDVEVAPSTASGKATGPATAMRARLLTGEEAELARRAINGRFPVMHGVVVPLFHRVRRLKTVYYELTPRE
jgi:PPOX class probable F420-dependent enzyme